MLIRLIAAIVSSLQSLYNPSKLICWNSPDGRHNSPRWHHLVFFIGPALLLYTLFMAWPLLDSLRLSFYQQQVDGSQVFIGLSNFNKLFGDPQYSDRFWGALAHNFQFFAVFMIVQNPVALLLAALLTSQRLKGAAIYRT